MASCTTGGIRADSVRVFDFTFVAYMVMGDVHVITKIIGDRITGGSIFEEGSLGIHSMVI